MADLLLFQPVVGHWETFKKHPCLPLGLLHAASLVDQEFDVKIIDQRLEKDWKEKLKAELGKQPLLFGTTSMTGPQIKYALEASRFVKENSDVPVVWGGPHASILPEQTLENPAIDMVVVGEGEETLLNLTRTLSFHSPIKNVRGVVYKKGDSIKRNLPAPMVDLNRIQEIPYNLVHINDYLEKSHNAMTLPLETSRGCPYACRFCYNKICNNRTWRPLTVDNSLSRLKVLVEEFGCSRVYFVDDNQFVDKKRMELIAEGIQNEKWDIQWGSQGFRIDHFDAMNPRYITKLKKSGLETANFGVESGSPKILDYINKRITVDQILRVNKKLRLFNIIPRYNFIVGFPNETQYDLNLTLKLVLNLLRENPDAVISHIACFTPYPKTDIYKDCLELGFKPPSHLEGWASYGWRTAHMPWVSNHLRHVLESIYVASLFVDYKVRKSDEANIVIKILARLYQPIAWYRMDKFDFNFMPESDVFKFFD